MSSCLPRERRRKAGGDEEVPAASWGLPEASSMATAASRFKAMKQIQDR